MTRADSVHANSCIMVWFDYLVAIYCTWSAWPGQDSTSSPNLQATTVTFVLC